MKKVLLIMISIVLLFSNTGFAENDTFAKDIAASGYYYDVSWPTNSLRVTSHFGERWGKMHYGIDIGPVTPSVPGDAIRAIDSGVVKHASTYYGYGLLVTINSKTKKIYDGISPDYALNKNQTSEIIVTKLIQSRYAHLNEISVAVGQTVYKNSTIGLMGHTGNTVPEGVGGTHLHFETRDNSDDIVWPSDSSAHNPLIYFPNVNIQSIGVYDKAGLFYDLNMLSTLNIEDIEKLGISTEEIHKLLSDDYVIKTLNMNDNINTQIIQELMNAIYK